uniref:Not1 domain-containing protein n=1 Tax=Mesocestoides corti TaxID=53468 RepID=A0A5K3G284_MESCO
MQTTSVRNDGGESTGITLLDYVPLADGNLLHMLQPERATNLIFTWLEIVAHRELVDQTLGQEGGWPTGQRRDALLCPSHPTSRQSPIQRRVDDECSSVHLHHGSEDTASDRDAAERNNGSAHSTDGHYLLASYQRIIVCLPPICQMSSGYLIAPGHCLLLNCMANQLRYPNSHTYYFSNTLLCLFAEQSKERMKELISRVLMESGA